MQAGALLAALLVAAVSAAHTTSTLANDGLMIATFHPNTSPEERAAHILALGTAGTYVQQRWDFSTFHAYSTRPTAEGHALMRASKIIKAIEPNKLFHAAMSVPAAPLARVAPAVGAQNAAVCKVQRDATWGLVRRNKIELEIDGLYSYDASASGNLTVVYIIDSGIYLEHLEFAGRALWGFDAVEEPSPRTDFYGHGTFVAGIVGGSTFGVSKNVEMVAVRVLNQAGIGSTSAVLSGLQYTASAAESERALALMAFSGTYSSAVNDAIAAMTAVNIVVVAPVGNNAADACFFSPASETTAIRVAASDSLDKWYPSSNFGNCSDVIAPGVGITSAWIGNPYSQNTLSGTSMAAANVAGTVANMISALPVYHPSTIKGTLTSTANTGAVTGVPTGTPNGLLYVPCS